MLSGMVNVNVKMMRDGLVIFGFMMWKTAARYRADEVRHPGGEITVKGGQNGRNVKQTMGGVCEMRIEFSFSTIPSPINPQNEYENTVEKVNKQINLGSSPFFTPYPKIGME